MIVYEDALCTVVMPEKPIALAHLKVFPKTDANTFEELDDETTEHIFFVSSYAATALFEGLQAQGTNIIMNNGKSAGQQDKLCIDVIGRYQDDKLGINWEPKQGDPKKIEDVFSKIKSEAFYIGKKKEKKQENLPKAEKIEGDNYMISHLTKTP